MDNISITRDLRPTASAPLPRIETPSQDKGEGTDLSEYWKFFRAFLRRPARVGSVTPSSRSLARAAVAGCELATANTVVELGPGTGVFTREILRHIGPSALFVALELDGEHALEIGRKFPGVHVYHDSAENIRQALLKHGRKKADCVISALPWGTMGFKLQDRVLKSIFSSLRHQGVFTTFAYAQTLLLPTGRHFRKRLETYFAEVTLSPIVWRNLPPAFVYRCR